MVATGVGERLQREGMRHDGVQIAFGGPTSIDFATLTGVDTITIYGQNEVVKDLMGARALTGRPLLFECSNVSLSELASARPLVRFIEMLRNTPWSVTSLPAAMDLTVSRVPPFRSISCAPTSALIRLRGSDSSRRRRQPQTN